MRGRDFDLTDRCALVKLSPEVNTCDFICGDNGIDAFFRHSYHLYEQELLTKTYAFVTDDADCCIVCIFTVSNDSVKAGMLPSRFRNRLQRRIPNPKRMRNYPAVLIGQMGVDRRFRGFNVGTQVLDYIKDWFTHPANKTGCRFLIVDALNEEKVIDFYRRNGFNLVYDSEDEEKEAFLIDRGQHLRQRFMCCDLLRY